MMDVSKVGKSKSKMAAGRHVAKSKNGHILATK
jgi:hypothetical protein